MFRNLSILANFLLIFQGFAEVEDLLIKEGICLAVTDKLIKDSGVAADDAYDQVVMRMKKKSAARGQIWAEGERE